MIARHILSAGAFAIVSIGLGTNASAQQPDNQGRAMQIDRKSDLEIVEGPAEWFTGKVTITGQFQRPEPSRVGGAIVRFEPGARTAWHKHPLGQTLIVTHIAIQESLNSSPVTWMEHVSDEQYRNGQS